jgi:hypothetical protein
MTASERFAADEAEISEAVPQCTTARKTRLLQIRSLRGNPAGEASDAPKAGASDAWKALRQADPAFERIAAPPFFGGTANAPADDPDSSGGASVPGETVPAASSEQMTMKAR